MDAKITLSFDASVINNAKNYASKNNISLSRLTEFLLRKVTDSKIKDLEELPVADWVDMVAEGEVIYQTKPRKNAALKEEFFKSKK